MTTDKNERVRIYEHILQHGMSKEVLEECSVLFNVCTKTIRNIVKQMDETGDINSKRKRRPKTVCGGMDEVDLLFVVDFLQQKPDAYMSELQAAVEHQMGVVYTVDCIRYAVRERGITRKVRLFSMFAF
jgi:transposase